MNAIELQKLTKRYPDFTLGELTLTLPEGCILGLIGENGAGKSTTFRLLLNQIQPDGGAITLLGAPPAAAPKDEIGAVPDEIGLPRFLSARQTGKVMAGVFRRWDDAAYARLLTQLRLPENKPFRALSQGTKKKLGLAVALAHHPRLLLLDEPTAGLDPAAREEVVELLLDFTRAEDHSILISSHIVSDLEKLCDYVAFLHRGRLLLCEEKDRLLSEYGLLPCTAEQLGQLPKAAVLCARQNPYGGQALVRKGALPAGCAAGPVSLEELFVLLVRREDEEGEKGGASH